MTRLLLGTNNTSKLGRLVRMLEGLPLRLVTPADLGGIQAPPEHGNEPRDIASAKACAYYGATGLPALSVDSALFIESLPPGEQPGVYVRRLGGT